MRNIILIIAVIGAQLAFVAQTPPSAAPILNRVAGTVTWKPSLLVNGAPSVFRVKPDVPLTSLRGLWLARTIVFDFDAAGGSWFALAGVGLDVSEGEYPLELEGVAGDGSTVSFRVPVGVTRGTYRTVDLRVADRFTAPNAATRARIAREQQLKAEAFARVTAQRLWTGRFMPPTPSSATDSFGVRRTFNGVQQSVHQGSDYRAKVGTPIAAMNAGRVLLARHLFFEGGCIVIDHGQGLLTIYMHLSAFDVKEGDRIERGQQIGVTGATGRVTGPHLHVSVRWQGIYLDPLVLVSLSMP